MVRAELTSINQKSEWMYLLKFGDETAIKSVIKELDRLENIIKEYELNFEIIETRINNGNSFQKQKS